MFFDYYYILWVLPAVIFAIWASARVSTTFQKYSAQLSHLGLSGSQAARKVLDASGVYQTKIEKTGGSLTDHYDPRTNIIRLSDSVCDRTSTAAIGVAAHEAGHAIQYAQGYLPIKIRNAIIPVTNIGSRLALPLILIGLLFAGEGGGLGNLAYLGVLCFGLSTLFQLITLPVEFDASRRALRALESTHILTGQGKCLRQQLSPMWRLWLCLLPSFSGCWLLSTGEMGEDDITYTCNGRNHML